MSDAFLTLAQAPAGLTCFLVPRWTPDGERNAIQLMRLKDKLGNRANASAEIEYAGAFAWALGEPRATGCAPSSRWSTTPGSTPRWPRPG